MNTTVELAKKHLESHPDNLDVLKADLIKVIRVAEDLLYENDRPKMISNKLGPSIDNPPINDFLRNPL